MFIPLLLADNFQTVAPSGIDGFSDEFVVDNLPYEFDPNLYSDYTKGSIYLPFTALWGNSLEFHSELMCTGWSSAPTKKMYFETPYSFLTSDPVTVICAPNRALMQCLQSTTSYSESLADSAEYNLSHGRTYWLTLAGTCTITILDDADVQPWAGYSTLRANGRTTRVLLYDINGTQPAITWVPNAATFHWQNGAPAFTVGKSYLLVEFVIIDGHLFGSFQQF